MQEIILFLFCFVFILIIYELFVVIPMKKYRNAKSNGKKIKKDKSEPVEIRFLVYRYGLDLKKVDYNQLLQIVSLTSSFDMAIVVSIIAIIDGYLWQMVFALVLLLPIFLVSYSLVSKFYKKKGMIKNV